MGMAAPHKIVLKDQLERFELVVERLEAVVVRLELVAPHSEPPTDPAALEAAERMIEQTRQELLGAGASHE